MTYLADATALVALLALFAGVLAIGCAVADVLERRAARKWRKLL